MVFGKFLESDDVPRRVRTCVGRSTSSAGNTNDAVSCLQQYLKIAKKTDNLTAQAEAYNLGVIHNRRGETRRQCISGVDVPSVTFFFPPPPFNLY